MDGEDEEEGAVGGPYRRRERFPPDQDSGRTALQMAKLAVRAREQERGFRKPRITRNSTAGATFYCSSSRDCPFEVELVARSGYAEVKKFHSGHTCADAPPPPPADAVSVICV